MAVWAHRLGLRLLEPAPAVFNLGICRFWDLEANRGLHACGSTRNWPWANHVSYNTRLAGTCNRGGGGYQGPVARCVAPATWGAINSVAAEIRDEIEVVTNDSLASWLLAP